MLKTLNEDVLKKIMKKGNITHSCIEYENMLREVLNQISKLKKYDFKKEIELISFKKELDKKYTTINAKLIFNCLLDSSIFMLFKWDSNYISQKQNSSKSEFIVASNRQAERYISSIKQQLNKNRNMKLIVIIGFCKLKNLSFQFQHFPLELRIQMKKHGRNLYNNSITRKELNDQKAFLYFQELDENIEKKGKLDQLETIRSFLVHEELLNSTQALTLAKMKEILKLLQNEGYYDGSLSIGNKEEHVKLFLNEIMNIDFTEYKRLNKL